MESYTTAKIAFSSINLSWNILLKERCQEQKKKKKN